MKEEIYRWVKTIAFFYIVFSAVLHLVPDVKYEHLFLTCLEMGKNCCRNFD